VDGLFKRHKWKQIQGNLIVFTSLGGLGIILWLIWDKLLFGDPLYFQRGPFSAQAQQKIYFQRGQLETYHSLWLSIKLYFLLTIDTVGLVPVILLGIAVLVFVVWGIFAFFKKKDRTALVVVMVIGVLLVPFAFYIESLYSGQAVVWIPGATPLTAPSQFFNTRYGIQTVAPIAVFLAILLNLVIGWLKGHVASVVYVLCALLLIAQAGFTSSTGIISFEAGLYGTDCAPTTSLDVFMAQHYDGRSILMDTFYSNLNNAEDGIDLKNIIYEGSGIAWTQALHDPGSVADWVVAGSGDLVSTSLKNQLTSPAFLQQFSLVVNTRHFRLYRKKDLPPLPNRALPAYFLSEHAFCTNTKA
jgi:hypothetical protein